MRPGAFLTDPLLAETGVAHGFGTRGALAPDSLGRPRQVHGNVVAESASNGALRPLDADAVVCRHPGLPPQYV